MSRKKLIKLGISVLALNALGVAAHYTVPNFIPTVLAETPGEDEEIPDAEERKLVVNFTNKLNEFEGDIQAYEDDPSDEDMKALLEDSINELATGLAVVKNGVKSPEGQASAAKLEARYNALVARANAALGKTTPTPPTPTETTKEVTETEEIPFTSREEKNADLPEGTRNIKTPGQKGEKTIVYTVTYVNGKETKREKKSETVTKQPVEEVVEVGTKKAAVVTTQELTVTEPIPYGEQTVTNPDLPEGTRNVKTPGENGEKTVVYTITLTDGVETKREKKSETVTKQPVDKVIEVGTKKAAVITTKEVTEKEEIPFTKREEENPTLPEGTRNVKTPGEKGEKTIVYTVTYTDGVETKREKKSESVTKQPVEEVVEVGTKKAPVVTTQEEVEKHEVPFTTREEKNADLLEGTRNVKTPGQKGERTIVYTVTYTDGTETDRIVKSDDITKQPVEEVVEVGTKKAPVVTTSEVTEKEEIPFTKREEKNADLPEGTRNVKTPGEKGEKTIVYTVTYTDGVETSRVVKSESVTKQPVEEVVEVGTKKAPVVTTSEVTEKEEIPFTKREEENPALPEGTRNVKTPGEKGEKTIVYTVTYTDGVETNRVVKSENVTKQPVEEVIEVGTKKAHVPVVTTKKVEQTLELPYKVIRKENPALAKGEERRVTVGKKGQALIVEEITYTDGVETGRKELERKVLVEPVDEFIYYGIAENPVKPVNPVNPVNPVKPVNPVNPVNPGKQEDPAKPADKVVALDRPATSPVVENKQALPNTGEKGTGILALLGATVLSMFGFLNRKKKG